MDAKKTVAELRAERGIKQETLAKALGITVPAYSRKERGIRPWKDVEMPKVAEFLGVPLEQIDFFTPRLTVLERRGIKSA